MMEGVRKHPAESLPGTKSKGLLSLREPILQQLLQFDV